MKISFLFLFFAIAVSNLLSDTTTIKYFPLAVGNTYIYNYSQSFMSGNWDTVIKASVLRDTVVLGRKYFKLSHFPRFSESYWYRVDTLTGSILRFDTSNTCSYYISESFIDSLAANQGDQMKLCGQNYPSASYQCLQVGSLQIFNISTFHKVFYYTYGVGSYNGSSYTYFGKNIGLYSYFTSSGGVYGGTTSSTLKGCVINGVVYGDTTMPRIVKNFFPMAVGNKYIYYNSWSTLGGGGSRFETSQITRDTTAYGRKYFWAVNFPFINNKWIREDTITGSLYSLDKTGSCSYYDHEVIIDSLLSGLGDSTKNCLSSSSRPLCMDTSYINIFGSLRQKKRFDVNCSAPPVFNCSLYRTYLDSIGIYSYFNASNGGGGGGQSSWQLRGGVRNGVVFGDTSTVIGLINISTEIPDNYMLSQNYPNPFNPVTNIIYSIKPNGKNSVSKVRIAVYDLKGSEIAALVNEEQSAGTYRIDFSGSEYSSGMYFYSLIVDGITVETKKMVLLK